MRRRASKVEQQQQAPAQAAAAAPAPAQAKPAAVPYERCKHGLKRETCWTCFQLRDAGHGARASAQPSRVTMPPQQPLPAPPQQGGVQVQQAGAPMQWDGRQWRYPDVEAGERSRGR